MQTAEFWKERLGLLRTPKRVVSGNMEDGKLLSVQ